MKLFQSIEEQKEKRIKKVRVDGVFQFEVHTVGMM